MRVPEGGKLRIRARTHKGLLFGGVRRFPHELAIIHYWKRNLTSNAIVFDVGANIGFHTISAGLRLRGLGGRLVCFEPDPSNLDLLRENIQMNGLDHLVDIVPQAVDEHTGVVRFYRDTAAGATGTICPTESGNSWYQERSGLAPAVIEVDCTTLDDFCFTSEPHVFPDVVKIDVEGAELRVLRGMRRLLDEVRPAIIVDGFKGPCSEFLRSSGYDMFDLNDDLRPVGPSDAAPYTVLARRSRA